MSELYKVPLEIKNITGYLEEEQNFLKGFIEQLKTDIDNQSSTNQKVIQDLLDELPSQIDKIYPLKEPASQIKALQHIAQKFSTIFSELKLKDLGIKNNWILLNDGYLGSFVHETYEISILSYLISAVYHASALKTVQTSLEYRYYFISALSAIKAAIIHMEKLNPNQDHYAYPFYQMLQLRKLEIEAEITKSEAFLARKKGDFEKASQYFAGAAAYRFSMMNFDLPDESDNRVKIFASTELGMACFYIAVGLSNKNESEKSQYYLLKAKSYFENAAKLSENNTELLEAANKRLELVNPYIERFKESIPKASKKKIEETPDPQPLMAHPDPEPLMMPDEKLDGGIKICSSCIEKIPWDEKCPKCKELTIPLK
ncbi:MAG: hypothetical protein EU548_08655 [Promethearchaeota archaeon]|nr:MAG: hypothetical protein EU548_08655 [Candidatus Lokiarchaeota archaeon]